MKKQEKPKYKFIIRITKLVERGELERLTMNTGSDYLEEHIAQAYISEEAAIKILAAGLDIKNEDSL